VRQELHHHRFTVGPALDASLAILRGSGAQFAYLHGSQAAGTARPDSDIDIDIDSAAYFAEPVPASFELDLPLECGGNPRPGRSTPTRSTGSIDRTASPSRRCVVVDEIRIVRLLRAADSAVQSLRLEQSANSDRRAAHLQQRRINRAEGQRRRDNDPRQSQGY
jgi:hypothetical protein